MESIAIEKEKIVSLNRKERNFPSNETFKMISKVVMINKNIVGFKIVSDRSSQKYKQTHTQNTQTQTHTHLKSKQCSIISNWH